jgi:F-type H+-transporting ATPase subunit delta
MASNRIASRYSRSLLDLATSSDKLEAVKDDMNLVEQVCSESKELQVLLRNPIIKSTDKKAVLQKIFSTTESLTQNFIAFLVDKNREEELPLVAENFISAYNQMKGIAKATIVSAIPLSEDTLSEMKTYVESLTGKSGLQLNNQVDPTIIGGVVIKHEDSLLDKSVSKELREIRKKLIYN